MKYFLTLITIFKLITCQDDEFCKVMITGGRESGNYIAESFFVDISKNIAGNYAGKKTEIASLPSGRYGHSMVEINNVAYVIGGRNQTDYLTEILAFDTTNQSPGEWIEIGNLISPREGHSSFVRGDFIISCGGQNRAKLLITCEAININDFKSEILGDMVRARKNMATVDLEGNHFLIGGDVSFGYTRSIEKISYDDGEFSANEYGHLDRILTEAGAVAVDENVFLFGGFDHNRRANFGKNTTLVYSFDEEAPSLISTNKNLTKRRRMHTTAMVNDNLVLLAGDYDARLASRNMELVDLETLESTEITVRDYHPVASAASIPICNN